MDIGKVAKLSGLPASTLRYYEEKGLIKSAGRNGLRRYYSQDVIEKLSLIALGRNAGLSLEEIAQMVVPDKITIDRQLLLDKASELDKQIKQMTTIRDGLVHAANCQAEHHLACPTFQRLMNAALKRPRKQKLKTL